MEFRIEQLNKSLNKKFKISNYTSLNISDMYYFDKNTIKLKVFLLFCSSAKVLCFPSIKLNNMIKLI